MSLTLSVVGLLLLTSGIAINFGPGWALTFAGAVLFMAGGLNARRIRLGN